MIASGRRLRPTHQPMHARQQIIRQQRLQPEVDIQPHILILGLSHPADHQHRHLGRKRSHLTDKLAPIHPRHNMVGNNQVNRGRELIAAKLLQRSLWIERRDYKISSSFKNGLACGSLNSIIVNQQYCSRHAYLTNLYFSHECAIKQAAACTDFPLREFRCEVNTKGCLTPNKLSDKPLTHPLTGTFDQ